MLVLTRKCGEKVLVPQYGIVLEILKVEGDRVRLGLSAPSDVKLYREELWELVQANASQGRVAEHRGERQGT
jgi:carbon storage regulator